MRETVVRPPWSPLSVTIITLLLPVGGIMLTIWNMQRMSVLDRPQALRMTIGAIAICAAGLGIIFGVAPHASNGIPQVDGNVSSILSLAAAFLCYVAQRQTFQAWRASNARLRTSSWLQAVGMALLYTLVTGVLSAPFWLLSESVAHSALGMMVR
jgi:hypothetical protein